MSGTEHTMEIGTKVRQKADPLASAMTVKLVTPQGYVVCNWRNPATGKIEDRMFFPEALEQYSEAP